MKPHALRRRLTLRSNVKTAKAVGRSHNAQGFSNRMLDTTVALMNAK